MKMITDCGRVKLQRSVNAQTLVVEQNIKQVEKQPFEHMGMDNNKQPSSITENAITSGLKPVLADVTPNISMSRKRKRSGKLGSVSEDSIIFVKSHARKDTAAKKSPVGKVSLASSSKVPKQRIARSKKQAKNLPGREQTFEQGEEYRPIKIHPKGSAFPRFHDADSKLCPRLADTVRDTVPTRLSPRTIKSGLLIRYRFDVTNSDDAHGERLSVGQEVGCTGLTHGFNRVPLDRGKLKETVHALTWENLLRALYGERLILNCQDPDALTIQYQLLFWLARSLHSPPEILTRLDDAYFDLDDLIFDSIREYPMEWTLKACAIGAPSLFREALTRLIASWNCYELEEKLCLPKDVNNLCEAKQEALTGLIDELRRQIITGFDRIFDSQMSHHKDQVPQSKATLAAPRIVRAWFLQAENLAGNGGSLDLYATLLIGGNTYLNPDYYIESSAYTQLDPVDRQKLENQVVQCKNGLRFLIENELKARGMFVDGRFPQRWIFVRLTADDYPESFQGNGKKINLQPQIQ
ncbi:hypothetical protein MMC25_001584 [Agyrium rufum]|nr:hypothetical protein [Agyrium rufum]